LIDFKIKIDNKTNTNTITIINKKTPRKLVDQVTLLYTWLVIQDTIEANISNDIQLEIHFSVISSHNHIKPTAHTVITKADKNKLTIVGWITVVCNK
jgi:hypothetical protein